MKSIVDLLLDEIKQQADTLTQEQKVELIEQLPTVLGVNVSNPLTSEGQQQSQSNTVSGVNQSGATNSLNFAPQQAGENANSSQTNTQNTTQNTDLQEVFALLSHLKQEIEQNTQLKPLEKTGAKQEVEKLENELQKDKPDEDLVGHTIDTLDKGLKGADKLIPIVQKVASLLGKVLFTEII